MASRTFRVCVAFASVAGCLAAVAAAAPAAHRASAFRPSRALAPVAAGLTQTVARASVSDPVGDTLGTGAGQIDATGLSAQVSGGDLIIQISFAAPISVPDSGEADALDGFLDLDTDQNGATGDLPNIDFFHPPGASGLGNEFYVDFFTYRSSDGRVDVIDDPTEIVVGRAPMSFTATTTTVRIPLALLHDDGLVNVGAVVGTSDQLPTDVVPNQGSVASTAAGDGGGGVLIDTGDTGPCGSGGLCLSGDRFDVTTTWTTQQGTSGAGHPVPLTADGGYFWFFDSSNVELVVKVLDVCSGAVGPPRFWVFAAGLTDVEVTLEVRDTETGLARVYTSSQGEPFAPIQDTRAFETCP